MLQEYPVLDFSELQLFISRSATIRDMYQAPKRTWLEITRNVECLNRTDGIGRIRLFNDFGYLLFRNVELRVLETVGREISYYTSVVADFQGRKIRCHLGHFRGIGSALHIGLLSL